MQFINNNPTKLRCSDPETITITVDAENVAAVRYSLDGATHDGSPFVVSGKSKPSPGSNPPFFPKRALVVGVMYAGDNGGKATITLTGSGGGTPSVISVSQAETQPGEDPEASDIVIYRFFIF